jgi:hypothetical protein
MRFLSILAGTTTLLSTEISAMDPGMWSGEHGMEVSLRGKFEAEGRIEFDEFANKLKERHGHGFDMTCAEACYRTPGCRNDPHQHWSYCKYDNYPATCFGLYHVPHHCGHDWENGAMGEKSEWGWGHGHRFGKLCFEPTQRNCVERYPVLCGKHHVPHYKHPMPMKAEDEYPSM